jgi:hypothetical protein
MDIQLKGLKTAAFQSQDSNCFEATVYVDGVRAFTAHDDGWGGCIDFRPVDDNGRALLDKAIEHAKTLPGEWFESTYLPMNLELLIGEMVEEAITQKWIARQSKKGTVFQLPGEKAHRVLSGDPYSLASIKYIADRYPGAKIIRP